MQHSILFTIIPRGISTDPEKLPVSIVVSPRLRDGKLLGEFPDWLHWTRQIKEHGLRFVIDCAGKQIEASVDTAVLEPELWEAVFNKTTLVRPFDFQDLSNRGVYSYSVRQTLSRLKETYQTAAILLGLPEEDKKRPINDFDPREDAAGYYTRYNKKKDPKIEKSHNWRVLNALVKPFAVNWNARTAKMSQAAFLLQLDKEGRPITSGSPSAVFNSAPIGADGLLLQEKDLNQETIAKEFSNFHRMPQPEKYTRLKDEAPDFSKKLDFHQAVSAFNNYPALQRAFGLVFDLELPAGEVPTTLIDSSNMSVKTANFGCDWHITPEIPELKTAYWYIKAPEKSYFLTAPNKDVSLDAIGLVNLDPSNFGLAQVDVDGGMHKLIRLAESLNGGNPPEDALHPAEFDNSATLSSLRSGGLSVFADRRALALLGKLNQSKQFEKKLQQGPAGTPLVFYAQDLIKGYRVDIWDDYLQQWHSLHQRNEIFSFGENENPLIFKALNQEGFVQLATTSSAAEGASDAFYLHESIARWSGWSLSAPLPGLALSSDPDPANALVPEEQNPMVTDFKMRPEFSVVPGTLPALRFGRKYAVRLRTVDLAGNSLLLGDALTDELAKAFGLPRFGSHFPYLRFEPVDAPIILVRDPAAITGKGSELMRIVIRSFNEGVENDGVVPDLKANDRMILPPRTSVEQCERLGVLDDEVTGKLRSDVGMYKILAERDGAELSTISVEVAGVQKDIPIEGQTEMAGVPYLPDVLSRGAALRNLPGGPEASIGKVAPGAAGNVLVPYEVIGGVNPRKGSATLVSFANEANWLDALPFRLALAEGNGAPTWDAATRLLVVYLPKGTTKVSSLSSYLLPADLEKMGMWQWLRSYIDQLTSSSPEERSLDRGFDIDRIEHILQRVVEGGHWMLTPPHLITFVHAVQQPLGIPRFVQTLVQRATFGKLETLAERENGTFPGFETQILTAWRKPNSTDLLLLGGLELHLPSSAKVDLLAEWSDPTDDAVLGPGNTSYKETVDEIPLEDLNTGLIEAKEGEKRFVGFLEPDDNLMIWGKQGDGIGSNKSEGFQFKIDAAPRHNIKDTKHHVVHYTAVATSRYKEYFDEGGADENFFTRKSAPITVHVPASARPLAPNILYILPTFGWQRQLDTSIKRSVRFGGGLRVYMDRPWFSSGDGELLGILHNDSIATDEKTIDEWKPFITQWGGDPIWDAKNPLFSFPSGSNFKDSVFEENNLTLEESTPQQQTVNVSGYKPAFDYDRKLWYCDITIDTETAYTPFIRLALARYQPYALRGVKLSRVVTADFIQTMPNRSLVVMPDVFETGLTRFTLSGVAPDGPLPELEGHLENKHPHPTALKVYLQIFNPEFEGDLAWENTSDDAAEIVVENQKVAANQTAVKIWIGHVRIHHLDSNLRYRLLFEEREYHSGAPVEPEHNVLDYPSRVVYLETIELGI